MDKKILYNVGPREAYVVDKTFDGDLNFLQLSKFSHDGELIIKRRPATEYVVSIDTNYEGEHQNSRSRVTHEMRRKLFSDMNDEHEFIVSSPKKYRRIPTQA